jgi:methylated-DNA-[protein]-cysteine S-methyltransferase
MAKPPSFRSRVIAVVEHIPPGKTKTYKEVALLAGNEKAARAVGAILKTNYDPCIPCHRVVKSDGTLGGYNRGIEEKRAILQKEQENS